MRFAVVWAAAAFVAVDALWRQGWPAAVWTRVTALAGAMADRRRRARTFRQWPQALLFLAGAVSAGATLDDALEHLAREAPEPLRSHVRRGLRASSLTSESRLRHVMEDPALRFARSALLLYLHTGGRVGRLLETTATVLQERVEAQARVKALTAQGRVSAWIVALTPFGLLAAMAVLAPDLTAPLVVTATGRLVLGAATGLIMIGLFLAQRLARVDT